MGGIVGNGKKDDKEIYFESEYTAETKIRQWEIDLNCFDKNFYLIICKLNTKSFMNSSFISKIITKEILEKYFSDRKLVYEQILDEKIFLINDEKYKSDYDSEKIKCLVFLNLSKLITICKIRIFLSSQKCCLFGLYLFFL